MNPASTRHLNSLALLAFVAACAAGLPASAIDKRHWELAPYTIHIELAVERDALGQELTAYLKERILATLHPFWSAEIEVANGPRRHQLVDDISTLDDGPAPESTKFDKQMVLTVVGEADGYRLACREWDSHTRVWGPVLLRTVRQELMLPEQCFDLLRSTFAPLASLQIDPQDENRLTVSFKGSELPRRTDEAAFVRKGDVFQPFLIRFDHAGGVLPDGVSEVPWTYLTMATGDDDQWIAEVHSGIRLPFGARRRGRSEHLAIAVRNPPGPTRVRFHARHNPAQGLSGYEVFRRLPDSDESEPMGFTDATGSIVVEPGKASIVTLFLRSDGQVLAKVPVSPGAKPLMDVPIADDSARLRAQAEMTAVREQLIDVVARRNILVARVRARLQDGKLDEARAMLDELDELPGRAQFDQLIALAERNPQNTSADRRTQQRIEQMFADTRQLLGRFLDLRQISDLRNQVLAAAREKKEPAGP